MKSRTLCAVSMLCLMRVASSQVPVIASFSHHGSLLAGNLEPGSFATIEWASSPEGPWTNTWDALQNVLVGSNGTIRVKVPMFYRVRGEPLQTPTNMVWIPSGMFTMGSPDNEPDRYDWEGPQTQVTVTHGYWIARHPVTQGEYLQVSGLNPSWFNGSRPTSPDPGRPAGEYGTDLSRPVDNATWHDATNYCALLTERDAAAGRLPLGYTYRLPTEAEWEFACRGGTATAFSHGDDPGYSEFATYGWSQANSDAMTHPVGLKLPNPAGLYDMHGNVWEWCLNSYYDYSGGSVSDPFSNLDGAFGVHRGGCWYVSAQDCRSASRGVSPTSFSNGANGFRVVLAKSVSPE